MYDPYNYIELEEVDPFDVGRTRECANQIANATVRTISILAVITIFFNGFKHLLMPANQRTLLSVIVTNGIVGIFSIDKLKSLIIFNFFTIFCLKCAYRRLGGYVVLIAGIIGMLIIQLAGYSNDDYTFFLSFRGILMMHIMRLVTVAFHLESSTYQRMPFSQFVHFIEYVHFPPFIVFGPYLTFEQFIKMRNQNIHGMMKEFEILFHAVLFVVYGVVFVIFSACSFDMYSPDTQFGEDFLTAMSFRFSHYFVCLVTQGILTMLHSDVIVANPLKIELSRSMLQTVSEWNRPFHTFLHENIFRRRFFESTALNVLLTFVVSALLHGVDVQMTLTLLALGFITYCETVFRKKLASRFSMCVRARPCETTGDRRNCRHIHHSATGRAGIINFLFGLLGAYHLVFTGMTFTDEYAGIGYPKNHATSIWKTHYYASFVISLVFLILSKIL